MFQLHTAILGKLPNLLQLLHSTFNVTEMDYLVCENKALAAVIHALTWHSLGNNTRYVSLRCFPRAACTRINCRCGVFLLSWARYRVCVCVCLCWVRVTCSLLHLVLRSVAQLTPYSGGVQECRYFAAMLCGSVDGRGAVLQAEM
jgi:hypothetical protein